MGLVVSFVSQLLLDALSENNVLGYLAKQIPVSETPLS